LVLYEALSEKTFGNRYSFHSVSSREVLLVCEEMNLLGGTMFALDGCKLPSNASKEWSGTIAELRRKKARIETKMAQLLEEQAQADQGQDDLPAPGASSASRHTSGPKYLYP
jgi:hypothetical protein